METMANSLYMRSCQKISLSGMVYFLTLCLLQGTVWVLEPEKVPTCSDESPTKGPKELKNKKGVIEVYPVKKYAKIKDRSLSLSDVDGSQAILQLLDYKILAVSGSDLSTKKMVPLSLAIRIASLRGTHIKPPPSDQLWFGFTSEPDIEWNLDSSIGEKKIVSSHVAFLLGNRLKALICDSLTVPNYESITVPWMSAEKDDWVARKVAPFMWTNQEAMDITGLEPTTISTPQEGKTKLDGDSGNGEVSHHIDKVEEIKNGIPQQPPEQSLPGSNASQSDSLALVSINKSLNRSKSEEFRKEETQQSQEQSRVESLQTSSSSSSPSSSQPQDSLIWSRITCNQKMM